MATSSIFHNIKINDPTKAEAFVAALEASENDPWIRPDNIPHLTVNTNPAESRRLHEMRKRNKEMRTAANEG